MKLWQDQTIVNALQHILEDSPNLEYDEVRSKNSNFNRLIVKITDSSSKVSSSIGITVTSELRKATGRNFIAPNPESINRLRYFTIMERTKTLYSSDSEVNHT